MQNIIMYVQLVPKMDILNMQRKLERKHFLSET